MNSSITAFLSAQALSIFGSAVASVAIPWLLLGLDFRPDQLANIFAIQSFAAILAAVLGTPLLDRFNKQKLCVLGDAVLATATFSTVSLCMADGLTPIRIAVIIALVAVVSAMAEAAGSSMIPELLTDADSVTNQRVNGMIGNFHNFGDLVGPAFGGLIITAVGAASALAIDGVSFLLSAMLVFCLVRVRSVPAWPPSEQVPAPSVRDTLLGGVLEIWRDPLLRSVTLVSAIVNMCISPLLVLLVPVLTKNSGGNAFDSGLLISAFGVGAFLASMLYTWKGAHLPPVFSLFGSILLALTAFALIPLLAARLTPVLLFAIGLSVGYLGPLEHTLVQNRAPAHLLGRIMLAYSASRTLLVPLGFSLVGIVLARGGTGMAFGATAGLLALAAVVLVYNLLFDQVGTQNKSRTESGKEI